MKAGFLYDKSCPNRPGSRVPVIGPCTRPRITKHTWLAPFGFYHVLNPLALWQAWVRAYHPSFSIS